MPSRLRRSRLLRLCGASAVLFSCAFSTQVARAQTPDLAAIGGTSLVASASGQSMPVGDLPGWRQIFKDDFTTNVPLGSFPAAVSSKWGAYPSPWKDTSGYGTYSPSKVISVANGMLNERIHTENNVPLVAALTPKIPGTSQYGQKYGRYVVRWRADNLPGYKTAWMLWPDSGNNEADGEIDFPERNLNTTDIWAFMHRRDSTTSTDQAWFKGTINATGWHTTVIEWKPNLVVFTLDGQELGRTTTRIPDNPMHWVMQTEVALTTHAKPSSSVAGNVQIDWVTAYAYDPSVSTLSTSDTTPPTVKLGSVPSTVSGTVGLSATASDSSGVSQMKWFVDGKEIAWDGTSSSWSASWATKGTSNGSHTLVAKARDKAGNWGTSPAVTVKVAN